MPYIWRQATVSPQFLATYKTASTSRHNHGIMTGIGCVINKWVEIEGVRAAFYPHQQQPTLTIHPLTINLYFAGEL